MNDFLGQEAYKALISILEKKGEEGSLPHAIYKQLEEKASGGWIELTPGKFYSTLKLLEETRAIFWQDDIGYRLTTNPSQIDSTVRVLNYDSQI